MATVGTKLTIPFTVGAGQIVGQGNSPELVVMYTTDPATDPTPNWIEATSYVRAVDTDIGRDGELSDDDAGTAVIVLDNRTRVFDPVSNAAIKPRNRWWIYENFTGVSRDLHRGYATGYEQHWVQPSDAYAVVKTVDEIKLLSVDALPTTSPPRGSYEDLIGSDNPTGYWRLNEPVEQNVQVASDPQTNPFVNPFTLPHVASPSTTGRNAPKSWH